MLSRLLLYAEAKTRPHIIYTCVCVHSNEKEQKKRTPSLLLLPSFLPACLPACLPTLTVYNGVRGCKGQFRNRTFPRFPPAHTPFYLKPSQPTPHPRLAHGQTGVPFSSRLFFFFFSSRHDLFSYLYSHERIIPFLSRHVLVISLFPFFFPLVTIWDTVAGFFLSHFSISFYRQTSREIHTYTCTKRALKALCDRYPRLDIHK